MNQARQIKTIAFLNKVSPKIIWKGAPGKIYLTFDDGPTPQCTTPILDLLKTHSVPATFFVQGERAEKNPGLIKRIFDNGHLLANHGYWHRPHWFCSKKFVRQSLGQTNAILSGITGESPRLFRPPFGRFGFNALQVCREFEMKIVLWNLMPHDYRSEINAEMIVRRVEQRLKGGRIIVLHDNLLQPEKLILSLPEIIEIGRKAGYEFSRLD